MDTQIKKKIFRKLLRTAETSTELEVIKLEFLIFPFILLGVGIGISIIVFGLEILLSKISG